MVNKGACCEYNISRNLQPAMYQGKDKKIAGAKKDHASSF